MLWALITVVFIQIGCEKNPAEMTIEQANDLTKVYFNEQYNLDVIVESVEYKQVGERRYRNFVTATNGDTEYNLILDKNNKPLSDDVSAVDRMNSIDLSIFKERLDTLGLRLHNYYDLESVFTGMQYEVWLSVVSEGLQNKDAIDRIYSLLNELKREGIDKFIINIDTPDFLMGNNEHGLRLTSIGFETDISKANLEEQYNNFIEGIYWNKQKFDDTIMELNRLGYKDAAFYISGWHDGRTLEIVLYCESYKDLSDEQAAALLKKIDDSYFKIADNKIKYTLRHVCIDR